MLSINLSIHKNKISGKINLPASKSISNRLQIIKALSNKKIDIKNLSTARDTQILKSLLRSKSTEKHVQDAGTVMRFLTAYYALKGEEVVLKGTNRMHERPIKILVDALNTLGATIKYLNKEGYPPLKINQFEEVVACQELVVDSSISSQYISSLLMIAPYLSTGLWLKMKGNISSKPYIKMTLELMRLFGVNYNWIGDKIYIPKNEYFGGIHKVESDWSAASYWYLFLCLSNEGKLVLKGLEKDSIQGDSIVSQLFFQLGIKTIFNEDGAVIEKLNAELPRTLEIDFNDFPDLAQTLAVACAVKGVKLIMKGVDSLKIKETNRLNALKNEFSKLGVDLIKEEDKYILERKDKFSLPDNLIIKTYDDHRMAMAFAPLSLLGKISFDNEKVVNKSYPEFWKEVSKLNQ